MLIEVEVTSDAAIFLKTWVQREVVSPLQTRSRNDSLLQRTRAHIDGQFRTTMGT